jgi:hypothetical protein
MAVKYSVPQCAQECFDSVLRRLNKSNLKGILPYASYYMVCLINGPSNLSSLLYLSETM